MRRPLVLDFIQTNEFTACDAMSTAAALPIAQASFGVLEPTGAAAVRLLARAHLAHAWLQAGDPDRAIEVLEPRELEA